MSDLKEKWGIDSNLIVYVLGNDPDFSEKTKDFFRNISHQNIDIYITHQNILEVQNVLKRLYRLSYIESFELIYDFINVLNARVVNPLPQTLQIYSRSLADLGQVIDHYDLYLASTLLTYDVYAIFTNNVKDFKKINNIVAVNPLKI